MLVQTACNYLIPKSTHPPVDEIVGPPSFINYDLKTMALYSGYVAKLTSFERVIECDKLVSGEAGDTSSIGIRLHTAFVMILTPECGGPEKAIKILESTQQKIINKKALTGLLAFQTNLAATLRDNQINLQDIESTLGKTKRKNSRLKNKLTAKDAELKQLEATLDALKRIEKTFHQRN